MSKLRIVYTETTTREVEVILNDDTNPLNHEHIANQVLAFVDEPNQLKSKRTGSTERTLLRTESIPE